jgi:hypothetical protein
MRDIQKDLKLCERTTLGPWIASNYEATEEFKHIRFHAAVALKSDMSLIALTGPEDCKQSNNDAQFIAEAREALPYWINKARVADEAINEIDNLVDVFFVDGRNYSGFLNISRIKAKIHDYRGGI